MTACLIFLKQSKLNSMHNISVQSVVFLDSNPKKKTEFKKTTFEVLTYNMQGHTSVCANLIFEPPQKRVYYLHMRGRIK